MVFLKAQLSGREDDIEFLIKCVVEHIESDIAKKEPAAIPTGKEDTPKYKKERPDKPKDSERVKTSAVSRRTKIVEPKKEKLSPKVKTILTGEEIFGKLNTKKNLKELKELLNQPKTKKYLDRLKKPIATINLDKKLVDKKGPRYDEVVRDYLQSDGEGKTTEVHAYLIEALRTLLNDTEDAKLKKPIQKIINVIEAKDEQIIENIKRLNKLGTGSRKYYRYDKNASAMVNQKTKKVYSDIKKVFDLLDKKLISNKDDEEKTLEILNPLFKFGEDFLIAVLRLIDMKASTETIENEFPKELFIEGEMSGEPDYAGTGSSEGRKKERRGVEILSERKLPDARRGAKGLLSRTDAEGEFVGLESYSSSRRKYTEEDKKEGKIPDGYKVGDRKPILGPSRDAGDNPFPRSKLKKAMINAFNLIDFSKTNRGYKIIIRTTPYNKNTEGIKEMEDNIVSISNKLKDANFKKEIGVDLFTYIKKYASIANPKLASKDFEDSDKKKEYKESIQSYMAGKLKEINAEQKSKRKVAKFPKALVAQYENLTIDIIKDLNKFYEFTMRKKSIQVQEGNLQRVKGDFKGFPVILAIREGPSDLGKDLKEIVDDAKNLATEEKERLTLENLKEFEEAEELLEETEAKLNNIASNLKAEDVRAQIKIIKDFIKFMERNKKKYRQVLTKIETMVPNANDFPKPRRGMSGKEFPDEPAKQSFFERVKKTLQIKKDIESNIFKQLSRFSAILNLELWQFEEYNEKFDAFLNSLPDETSIGNIDAFTMDDKLLQEMKDGQYKELFDAYTKTHRDDFAPLMDLDTDIRILLNKEKRLKKKLQTIKTITQEEISEAREKELLLQFYEARHAKLSGKKVKPDALFDKLLQSFRQNPLLDEDGNLITAIPDIAKYLEEKYDKSSLSEEELEEFMTSIEEYKEGKEEEE